MDRRLDVKVSRHGSMHCPQASTQTKADIVRRNILEGLLRSQRFSQLAAEIPVRILIGKSLATSEMFAKISTLLH